MQCPECSRNNPDGAKFCNGCGLELKDPKSDPLKSVIQGERKHATILFSDLSGYTAMSEKLDPEEVKEIMGDIFGVIAVVLDRYGGFIEKYIGDAVMAVFGVPYSHEDDPVRAIHAAMEIRRIGEKKRAALLQKTGQSLAMHTGINTGLVVTGDLDLAKGTHGVLGDTVNVAARLSSIAGPDQIVVDQKTFSMARGYFDFKEQPPVKLKGKKENVRIHLALSPKTKPHKVHRFQGLRSAFIGRNAEMEVLDHALEDLNRGKGSFVEVVGGAGCGKSRLIEEFKGKVDLAKIQWLEGHSYSYSQSVAYGPWLSLFRRVCNIGENTALDTAKERLEALILQLRLEKHSIAPYIGGLLSIPYPEVEEVSPEYFQERFYESVIQVVGSLTRKEPTIFCFEDLHWADRSSIELLKLLLRQPELSALFLCLYRPTSELLSPQEISAFPLAFRKIEILDFSPAEIQDMLQSLLGESKIPNDLIRFAQKKAEGNPFYLEEIVNALVDSEVLIRSEKGLLLSKPLDQAVVPPTVQEVITARLDRLERETKLVLQEASVIGRSFWISLLQQLTALKASLNNSIDRLESLDLIRYHSSKPDLEYIFKHALTQEVVYNGLLKKQRRTLHQQVAESMEVLFAERLPEFYEALAYHFSRGESIHKAADYLIKSGEKSLKLYALKESQQFFLQAYELMSAIEPRGPLERQTLISILNKWASVFYFTGDVKGLMALLKKHEHDADQLDDMAARGMFYAWYGWALGMLEQVKESFRYLYKALAIGEQTGNQLVIGYACTWLVFSCFEELLDDGLNYGTRAQEIAHEYEPDQYLFFKSLCGLGHIHFMKGEGYKSHEIGQKLLNYGHSHANVRCITVGHLCLGYAHAHAGRFPEAIQCYKQAIKTSRDPIYANWARCFLGMAYILDNQFAEAEVALAEVVFFSRKYGYGILGTIAQAALGVVIIDKGQMSSGMKLLSLALESARQNDRTWVTAFAHYLKGTVYLQIVEKNKKMELGTVLKNIGFILKHVPRAAQKGQRHFSKAIELLEGIRAYGLLGQVHLDMALLKKAQGNREDGRDHLESAREIFVKGKAENFVSKTDSLRESFG